MSCRTIWLFFSGDKVTDKGLAYLCKDDGINGKCKKLQKLLLVPHKHSFTREGVFTLLDNLPLLQSVSTPILSNMLRSYAELNPHKTLPNLETMDSSYHEYNCQKDLEVSLKVFPSFAFSVKPNIPLHLDIFLLRTKLPSTIEYMSSMPFQINEYVSTFADKIQTLYLNNCEDDARQSQKVDIGLIAKYCPNLERLSLNNVHCSPISSSGLSGTFANLKDVTIEDCSNQYAFPEAALNVVMSVVSLRSIKLVNAVHLTEDFVNNFVIKAMNDKQILSKVHTLSIEYNKIPASSARISQTSFVKLMYLTPKLKLCDFKDRSSRPEDVWTMYKQLRAF